MKTLLIFIVTSFVFLNVACAQQNAENHKIVGRWKYADSYECPDVLVFNSNGTYEIYNDCGSIDPMNPIIEKGRWTLEAKDSMLILTQREFISPNSVFSEYHGKNEIVLFKVMELSKNTMVLRFTRIKDYVLENYKRLE